MSSYLERGIRHLAHSLIRKNGIPLYVQVKDKITSDIRLSVYKAGDKLPTERELSQLLGVSRNTISQAYRELEFEGILISLQGRGTFVADRDDKVRAANRRDLLQRVIDVALEESIQLGFTLDDFLGLAAVRANQKAAFMNNAQVVFVECNREQVEYFSRKLEFGGVHIIPVVLSNLVRPDAEERLFAETADLVITTFFHYDEVRDILGSKKEVLAISLDPELETIVQVARISSDKDVGLVCRSENFAGKVISALKQAGLTELASKLKFIIDPEDIANFVKNLDVVIVSPGRRREVETYCRHRQNVIEFIFKADAASANLLRAALAEVRHPLKP